MYQRFYGLTQKPFHATPDPDFLYLSPSHKQALGTIMYGIEQRKGFIAVLGEVGLGKTTILRAVLAKVETHLNRIIYLRNPNLSFRSFLQTLLRELGKPQESTDEAELISHVHHVLIDEYEEGKTVVLFIDEAQIMPIPTLEGLRLLSNLETEKDKLIQLVLVGQPELRHILERHELRQLDQRIAVRATIFPLTTEESHAYIRHRLDRAGAKNSTIFSKRALRIIIQNAKGNPRQINRLCDNALVTGVGYNKTPVTTKILKEVIADMQGMRPRGSWKWSAVAASLVGFVLLGGWIIVKKPIDSLGLLSFMTVSEFILPETEKRNALPITKETNHNLDDGHALVMESQQILPPQMVPLAQDQTQKFRSYEGQRNNRNLNLIRGEKIDINPEATLLTEKGKNIPIKESLPDTMVNAGLVFSQAKNAEKLIDNNRVLATKVIQEGDTLEKLLREVYGVAGPKKVQLVLAHNPQLESAKKIFPDQVVAFPSLSKETEDGKMATLPLEKPKSFLGREKDLVVPIQDIFTQSSSLSEANLQASLRFPIKILAVATVQEGDTLERLTRNVYGIAKPLYIKEILRANPHIQDSKHLSPGQILRFPKMAVEVNKKKVTR